ncbi:MAG: hypothetical protein V3V82_02155, partial [Acidimicrobiia bacterium]
GGIWLGLSEQPSCRSTRLLALDTFRRDSVAPTPILIVVLGDPDDLGAPARLWAAATWWHLAG